MPEDRRSLEALIDQVGRLMVDAGIDERDDDVIRNAAENVAHLVGAVGGRRPPDAIAPVLKSAYTKEEIDRLNRAAETYFQRMKDPSFVLNKPMSGIFDPPILLYRFSVLLASLEI